MCKILIQRHHVWYSSCQFRVEGQRVEDDEGMRTISRSLARMSVPLLVALFCTGCARPLGNDSASAKSGQRVPFRDTADPTQAVAASGSALAVPSEGSGPPRDLPFHGQNLPPGTLLNVRLNEAISTTDPGTTTNFTATLDEPVVSDGRTVLPSGTSLAGQVESVRPSDFSDRRGHVRLTLNSIHVNGHDLSITTSTLFARGTIHPASDRNRASSVELEPGRRLTFRLAEPLAVSGQVAISSR